MGGFEPPTHRVTAERSAAELHQIEAGEVGVEPTFPKSESGVLPLDRLPRIVAELGLEPRLMGSRPTVLPLDRFRSETVNVSTLH